MSWRESGGEEWRRSRRCESAACAEVKVDGDGVLIRSSEEPERTVRLTAAEWEAFRAGVVAGDFG